MEGLKFKEWDFVEKILLVSDTIYPDSMGGSHRHVYELAKNLIKKGYRVWIITSNKNGLQKSSEIIDGIEIHRYFRNSDSKLKGFVDFIIGPYKTYKSLKKLGEKFDVIHGHWPLCSLLIFFKEKKSKKIYTFHGPVFEEYSYELKDIKKFTKKLFLFLVKAIESKTLANADKVITASNYMKNKIEKYYRPNLFKVNIIPVGTDTEKFKPKYYNKKIAREEIKLKRDKIYLLTIRRLQKRMGVDNLIRAIKIVCKDFPEVVLLVGGKGQYKEELEVLVNNLGLKENVKFLGFIPEEKLSLYYEAANLFIMPSIDLEGFGLSTTEALSNGTKVVVTPVGGNVEILSDFAPSFISDSVNYNDIAKKLKDILNDNKSILKYDEKARKYVEDKYSWKVLIKKILLEYNNEKK